MAGRPHIGISGWTYTPWRRTFYPDDLPQKRELEFASKAVNSIEINGTFYSLQTPKSFGQWRDVTPEGFVFSVKGGRYITHLRRLKDVEGEPLANFFAQGILTLGPKLGPILWQLPPMLKFDEARIDAFLSILPRNFAAAAKLAEGHSKFMKKRVNLDVAGDAKQTIRHAMEVRHESFKDERFLNLLRRHGVALVVADTAGKWPLMEDVTADFIYVRLHGDAEIYVSGYTDPALDTWAKRVKAWLRGTELKDARRIGPAAEKRAEGRDVYVYFDNDVKVRSPFDAIGLAWRVAGAKGEKPELPDLGTETQRARSSWAPMEYSSKKKVRRPARPKSKRTAQRVSLKPS